MSKSEPPSKKGGRRALSSSKISASRIAKSLKDISFPKSKRGILLHLKRQHDSGKKEVISVLSKISNKKYQKLVDVENEVATVK